MKNNENQSKEYLVPMEVTNETIRDFGIDPKKVVYTKIGNKNVKAIMVPVDSKAQYDEYMRPLWAEAKREERSRRCTVSNGKGKLKRCTGDCSKCERLHEGSAISLDELQSEGIEVAHTEKDTADIVIDMMLLDELTKALEELDPDSRRICELIKEGFSDRGMAAECKLPKSTLSDKKKRLLSKLQKQIDGII
ncbi:sigma-70 family RNA polymerase sigma factor [Haloimpatiens sp. FM7315]|uniref:sigma-70 family RNA polymerase sigma factor n=1 Tax=Haloimpatiens sp. FM7315 TaxID=3298609 RepID=UPI00370C8454